MLLDGWCRDWDAAEALTAMPKFASNADAVRLKARDPHVSAPITTLAAV